MGAGASLGPPVFISGMAGGVPSFLPSDSLPGIISWMASRKRDSESSRNCAEVTTSSPPLRPERTSRYVIAVAEDPQFHLPGLEAAACPGR